MTERRYGDHDRSYETQRRKLGGDAPQHAPDTGHPPSPDHETAGARFGGHPHLHPDQGEGPFRGVGPMGYVRSDERISDDLHAALADHSHLDASGITVSVKAGEATLDGVVRSRACKRLAEDLADRVWGMRHVQNNLRVKPPAAVEPIGAARR